MSAALALRRAGVAARAAPGLFSPPFDGLDDAALLAHFQGRRSVAYFAVADVDETRPEQIEAIMGGHFRFNGEGHTLPDPLDWLANPSRDIEWHILLHKFYYAVGLGMAYAASGERRYGERFAALVEGWMAQVPAGFIAADVTGRRVQNWIYAYRHFVTHGRPWPIDPGFHRRLLESLHRQVEYLCAHLTPARNHRTLELYAIFLAGVVFPEMTAARRWREFAAAELARNMAADLLPDGVQCELSTDYHHLVLKNYLNARRLAAMNGIAMPAQFDGHLLRALEFSLHAHKPDGIVPSLSDGDARGFLDLLAQGADLFGRADLRWVASGGREGTPPAARTQFFPDSGYAVVRSHWGTAGRALTDAHYLIFDCGPLGAGNHGHFDCLSFELAAHGRSLVVDPGRYTYSEAGEVNWRVAFRSTAAHNTVTVDGRNQTRYLPRPVKDAGRHALGSLRHKVAGPPPEAQLLVCESGEGYDYLHGVARSHEYDAVHERRILFVAEDYWLVLDRLDAPTEQDYELRFQLSEVAWQRVARRLAGDTLLYDSPGLLVAQPLGDALASDVEAAHVSYRYGHKLDAPRLRFHRRGREASFATVLWPHRGAVPRLALRRADTAATAGATALVVESGEGAAAVTDFLLFGDGRSVHAWDEAGLRCRGRFLVLRREAGGRVLRRHHDPAGWCEVRP